MSPEEAIKALEVHGHLFWACGINAHCLKGTDAANIAALIRKFQAELSEIKKHQTATNALSFALKENAELRAKLQSLRMGWGE